MNYDDLRAKALAATPGPWFACDPMNEHYLRDVLTNAPGEGTWTVVTCNSQRDECDANTRFVATANPATVLALLDEIAALRADAERLDWLDGPNGSIQLVIWIIKEAKGAISTYREAIDRARLTRSFSTQGVEMPLYKNEVELNPDFLQHLVNFSGQCYSMAADKGFWDEPRNKGEMIALMHSELSEMLEGVRKPGPDNHCPNYSSEEVEAADLFIRLMDYVNGHGLRFAEALQAKYSYNATRPHKHGKGF